MSSVALIAIGYNKENSLLRLLESLNKADYRDEKVPLIISIDKSDSDKVCNVAQKFQWNHGEKEIRTFHERQGLKKHILSCADYLQKYEAVFIFEDDIVVSPYFYHYGKACIEYYSENDNIEGISLYSAKWNPNGNFPFEPIKTGYDTYFHQYAQSWGQIWLRKRWKDFMTWYHENEDFFEKEKNADVPANLYTWGKNSWLKYHIAYCAIKNKYFVYPYFSFTTAFVENGTHFGTDITRFHSDMMLRCVENYRLAPFDESAVFYDTFFENIQLRRQLDSMYKEDFMVDLYGCRDLTGQERYVLSTKLLPYNVMKEYALQLRPIEMNIYMEVKGTGIYLYDVAVKREVRRKDIHRQISRKWNYFMKERFLLWEEIWPVCWEKAGNLVKITKRIFFR